jgi:hypothetical protein
LKAERSSSGGCWLRRGDVRGSDVLRLRIESIVAE